MRAILAAILVTTCIAVAGCAASPETLSSVAQTESGRLAPPTKRFSSYASYELKPMVLSEAVKSEPGKVEEAAKLEAALRARIQPLLTQWQTTGGTGRSGALLIEPRLASLKVVSGTARFWAGALAGDSSIDMDLVATDKDSGEVVSKVRIARSADAMTGGWSIGKSDQNLRDYIASISEQYLKDNY